MNPVSVAEKRHQSLRAWLVSSGALSQRNNRGARPRRATWASQLGHGLIGADGALDAHHQRLAGELVDNVDQTQRTAIGRHVGLELDRPHLVGTRGAQRTAVALTDRHAALARPGRHAQALLAPQPLGTMRFTLQPLWHSSWCARR
jgi:hypothetical protein